MFDFIPLKYYTDLYYIALAVILAVACLYLNKHRLTASSNIFTINMLTFFLLFLGCVYMGMRPISGFYFGDMSTYNQYFLRIQQQGISAVPKTDYVFNYFMYLCTLVMTNKMYFIVLAVIYVWPLYYVAKINFNKGAFYLLFFLMGSFSFWAYGTNGLRNGIATSVFLLVFATKNRIVQIAILFLAFGIHSSMIIPIAALVVAYLVKNTKYLVFGWLAAIPVSLIAGGTLQVLFSGLMQDDRTSYLTAGNVNDDTFSGTGFRWDFVLYSAAAVYAGWYYIFKKNYRDQRYLLIYGTFLIANAFWIIVIKANFSNRFAYLSWFLMGLVIGYPLLKEYMFKDHNTKIIYILLSYFAFTFLMNVIIY